MYVGHAESVRMLIIIFHNKITMNEYNYKAEKSSSLSQIISQNVVVERHKIKTIFLLLILIILILHSYCADLTHLGPSITCDYMITEIIEQIC